MTFVILSEYIAPWALPKENIPIHLHWRNADEFDEILLKFPNNMELTEFYNVDSYNVDGENYRIIKLKTLNYFGFALATKNIIKELHETFDISIEFFKDKQIAYKKIMKANVFRPYLTVIDTPRIVTSDRTKKQEIKTKLKLSGFGKISMKIELNVGGKFFENSNALYEEIVRRILRVFKWDEDSEEIKSIKIDEKYIARKTEEYLLNIQNGIFPQDITREDLINYKEWIESEENKLRIKQLIAKQIESVVVDSIIYHLEKYSVKNVQMPYGAPKLIIDNITQEIRFRFRYQDALFNDYEPLTMEIELKNERDLKGPIEIPIHIEWEFNEINPEVKCEMIK